MKGEKLPLLVIAKSARPQCFPRDYSALPVSYRNNRKAWVTGEIFENWLRNLDHKMKTQKP